MKEKLRIYNVPEDEMLEAVGREVSSSVAGTIEHLAEKMERLEEQLYAFKEVLTHREIATYCGVEIKTVLHWIHKEDLPAVKRGRVFYAKRTEFEAWLVENPTARKHRGNLNQAA